jgi:prephenate dehydrogenase
MTHGVTRISDEAGIIGLGRCGQLAARLLRDHYRLTVTDISDRSAEAASLGVKWDSLESVATRARILLAVPIRAMPTVLGQIAPHLTDGALVVDVCSVKSRPMEWMAEHLPAGVRSVGTHPLFGPDSVSKQGVNGQRIVVCAPRGQEAAAEEVCRVATEIGLEVVVSTPDEHDRQMARSQAVVFLLARAMQLAGLEPAQLGTPSERQVYSALDLVVGDTDELYEDILTHNPHVSKPVRALCAAMMSEIDRCAGSE